MLSDVLNCYQRRKYKDGDIMSWIVLLCLVMFVVFQCDADVLPPPTDLQHKWHDPFSVNLSWSWHRPSGLQNDCDISYQVHHVDSDVGVRLESKRHSRFNCLTNEKDSCTYSVQTVGEKSCNGSKSRQTNITVHVQKPRGEVMRDLKCMVKVGGLNCSWIPVHPYLNLTLIYRDCELETKPILQKCKEFYSTETRAGCYLNGVFGLKGLCILMENENGRIALNKSHFEAPAPNLSVTEDGHHLNLTWKHPEGIGTCDFSYELCYSQCNGEDNLMKISRNTLSYRMLYDTNCQYRFKSRVLPINCMKVEGMWSEYFSYGTNKNPDVSLTVAAVVIPVLVFVCITLSCYCFRKHSDIICPKMPDPSAIFKEMMMSGNKELKIPADGQYKPVAETVDTCLITSESVASHLHAS